MDKTIYATIAALIGEDGSLTEQPRFPENQLTLDNGEVIEYAPGEIDGNILYFNGFGFGPRQAEAGNLLDAAIADLEAGDPYSSRAKFRLFGTNASGMRMGMDRPWGKRPQAQRRTLQEAIPRFRPPPQCAQVRGCPARTPCRSL